MPLDRFIRWRFANGTDGSGADAGKWMWFARRFLRLQKSWMGAKTFFAEDALLRITWLGQNAFVYIDVGVEHFLCWERDFSVGATQYSPGIYYSDAQRIRFARPFRYGSISANAATMAGFDSNDPTKIRIRRIDENAFDGTEDTVVTVDGSLSSATGGKLGSMWAPNQSTGISPDGNRVVVSHAYFSREPLNGETLFDLYEWNPATKVFDSYFNGVGSGNKWPSGFEDAWFKNRDGSAPPRFVEYGYPYDDDPYPYPYEKSIGERFWIYTRTGNEYGGSFWNGPVTEFFGYTWLTMYFTPYGGEPHVYLQVVGHQMDAPVFRINNASYVNVTTTANLVNRIYKFDVTTKTWSTWRDETVGHNTCVTHIQLGGLRGSDIYGDMWHPRGTMFWDGDGNPHWISVENNGITQNPALINPPFYAAVIRRTSDDFVYFSSVDSTLTAPTGYVIDWYDAANPYTYYKLDTEINILLDDNTWINNIAHDSPVQGEFQLGASKGLKAPQYLLPTILNLGQDTRGAVQSRWTGLLSSTGDKGLVWRYNSFGSTYADATKPTAKFSRSAKWAVLGGLGAGVFLEGSLEFNLNSSPAETVHYPSFSDELYWTVTYTGNSYGHIREIRRDIDPVTGTIDPLSDYALRVPLKPDSPTVTPVKENFGTTYFLRYFNPGSGLPTYSNLTYDTCVPATFVAMPVTEPIITPVPKSFRTGADAAQQLYRGYTTNFAGTKVYFPTTDQSGKGGVQADLAGVWACVGGSPVFLNREGLFAVYGALDLVIDGPLQPAMNCSETPTPPPPGPPPPL